MVHIPRDTASSGAPLFREYPESAWYREIVLPADANGAKTSAELKRGVLTIRVPKRRTLVGKPIPVYAA